MTKGRWVGTLLALAMVIMSPYAAAADKVRVAIGQKGLWDTLVVHQGLEQGIFQKAGLDIEATWTRGGAETLQAIITGSADFALANGVTGVLGAYQKGAPVRIVSAQMTGAGDLFWYVKAESPIKSMKDMNGKTMGYSRPGSSTHLVALALAQAAGVKPTIVSSGDAPGTRVQVMSGQIDAGWSAPPNNLELVTEGKIRILARGSDVKSLNDQTVRVNAANLKFLTEKRDVARRFMKAYADTVDWMYSNPGAATAFFAKFNQVTPEVAKQSATFYTKQSLALAPVAGLQLSIDQALEYKSLDKPMTLKEAQGAIDIVYQPGK
jgi:NitT/TauT family transport system substrate-binding protein